MSDDDDKAGAAGANPAAPLSVRRVVKTPEPVRVRSLTLPTRPQPQEHRDGPPLFETLRVVDLARFRAGLVRSLARLPPAEPPLATDRRQSFLTVLDKVRELSPEGMPHVAVVRRSHSEALTTNFSIVGNLIFLGAHLSSNWTQGREDPAYQEALMDAIATYLRRLESRSGTRTIQRPFHN